MRDWLVAPARQKDGDFCTRKSPLANEDKKELCGVEAKGEVKDFQYIFCPFSTEQHQLNSPRLSFFCASIAKIRYLVHFWSHVRRGFKSAYLILLCDVNRLLATDWPEIDATGRIMMSATLNIFKY